MQIEKIKATVRGNKMLSALFAGPNWVLGQIKAPQSAMRDDLPGQWTPPQS